MLITPFLGGCFSYTVAVGDWQNSPTVVSIEQSPLKDVSIRLICGEGPRMDDLWEPINSKACEDVAEILLNFGVNITGDYEKAKEKPDSYEKKPANIKKKKNELSPDIFKLMVIDRGEKIISSPSAICYYFTIYPCIRVKNSKLEFRFIDRQNSIISQNFIQAENTEIFGIGALPFLATRHLNDSVNYNQKVLPKKLATFVANITHSVLVKMEKSQSSIVGI